MVVDPRNEIYIRFALLASAISISLGCVNLDKRDPAPFRFGQKSTADQTVSTKAGMRKSPKKMKSMAKPSGIGKMVKQAWPFRSKVRNTVQDAPIAQNDPTRLDYVPENVGADLHIATAKMAEKSGDVPEAMKQYQMALNKDGKNRNALIGFARLHHRVGNTKAAIQVYRDALNIYRQDAVIMNDLGICYARTQQPNESIALLEAATRAAPQREMYMNNLAAALVDANRTNEAFTRLAQSRGPAIANYNIGYLLTKSGRENEAQPYLQQALQLKPDMQQARALLAKKPVYQVSSRPQITNSPVANTQVETVAPPKESGYVIPVENDSLSAPAAASNDASWNTSFGDDSEAVEPPANSVPWQQSNVRIGPFGFTPEQESGAIQVVSYVEEVTD